MVSRAVLRDMSLMSLAKQLLLLAIHNGTEIRGRLKML